MNGNSSLPAADENCPLVQDNCAAVLAAISAPDPVANDDTSLNNPLADVVISILDNDELGDGSIPAAADVTVTLDETSVPGGVPNLDGSVTVPGQGI